MRREREGAAATVLVAELQQLFAYMALRFVCVCACVRVCMCVCVYVCVCVCVCV